MLRSFASNTFINQKIKHKEIHIIRGKNPILISAPHTRPIIIKDEKVPYTKAAEYRMTEIVDTLCNQSGAWGIFIKGNGKIHNWEKELRDIYKEHLTHIILTHNIGLFIEVHGSRSSRPFIIDYDFIIPNQHPNDEIIENLIVKNAQKYFSPQHISTGFFRSINGPGEKTFTHFVRRTFEIPAIQIEINKKARQYEKQYGHIIKILHTTIARYCEENLITKKGG